MVESEIRPRFITFEGIEGAGKTLQIERLRKHLADRGLPTVVTREPGGTALGRELRAVLLRPSSRLANTTELLLYTADRAQHLAEVIEPALDRGSWVLCDRYLDATLAYQGYGRGLGLESILELHRTGSLARRPDLTLLLDLEVEVGLGRARSRNAETGVADTEGRFEAESLEFHQRVRDGYLALARQEPARFRLIDATETPDRVSNRVLAAIAPTLPARCKG